MTQNDDIETSVLYNADCPVCSYEINHYARYSRGKALPIRFDDLNDTARLSAWNLDADTAARRLYVLKNGQLLAGIPAFIALWQAMPRYRWMARAVRLPGIFHIACGLYDYLLAPAIYRWHLLRMRNKTA